MTGQEDDSKWINKLFFGDNLDVLKQHFADESVDLVYLDPPFQSGKQYNLLFKQQSGARAHAQIQAFDDTWEWTEHSIESYDRIIGGTSDPVARVVGALHSILGPSDMLAYLVMMTERLIELQRILKDTGSVYLHCDPTASHYLKIIMDQVFGVENFLNEVIWMYGLGGSSKRYWPRKHDVLLWYSKTPDGQYFNADMIPATSLRMKGQMKKAPDYWDIPSINNMAAERLGYPTQKPLALLERIVRSSSPPGGLVLDPFCGCGTAVEAAERLGRRWCGIDITTLAIDLVKQRLDDRIPDAERSHFEVTGLPHDVEGARALFERSPLQFEHWAVTRVNGAPNKKQVGDKGIDGTILLATGDRDRFESAIISVKGGKTINPAMVRDLIGTINSHNAEFGILISTEQPTKKMLEAGRAAGSHVNSYHGKSYPRIHFVTVDDILNGRMPELPPSVRQTVQAEREATSIEAPLFDVDA